MIVTGIDTLMKTLNLWLLLREHFDPVAYNQLFRQEIESLSRRLTDHRQRQDLANLEDFDWVGYIAASLRNAGYRDQEVEDRVHEIVVRLLVLPGTLFQGYDERRHGPLIARFKTAVGNAIRNQVEEDRNRRKRLQQISMPIAVLNLPPHDAGLIEEFRELIRQRLGPLALAVFDSRLEGEQVKSLVGVADLGSPTAYLLKQAVQRLKRLAAEYGRGMNDHDFTSRIEAAIDREAQRRARR
jgi:Arc/MetJ family transcription regulator